VNMNQADRARLAGLFEKSLAADIVPFIENNYRVLEDQKNRAIAGLSMGGGHIVRVTLDNPDMFGYIGIFSAGIRNVDEAVEKQYKALQAANPALYWVACGMEDTLAYSGSQALVDLLKKIGLRHAFRESTGGHTWANWRIYLSEMAPLLFK
jgi:enterochelin esterase-like enzyme